MSMLARDCFKTYYISYCKKFYTCFLFRKNIITSIDIAISKERKEVLAMIFQKFSFAHKIVAFLKFLEKSTLN
ncbi:hypothetical protein AB834_03435 [PVC group bacterium (ex Bugula neritina AB1)]|nr:hypothetical protein AB834_03435 [PVC group bacterium (ex Bugula neritina AB1)]